VHDSPPSRKDRRSWQHASMQFDSAASLRLIAESLGLVDRLGAQPIRVRVVRMVDRTLVVEITVDSDEPMTVRGEIANVMGAVSGLDVPGLFPVLGVQSIGVRAFGAADEELLWIMSSIEAAGFIARGQPIEWLSRSLIQENTPAYRRSQADRRIGQVETALRDLIDQHANASAGAGYVDQLWAPRPNEGRRPRCLGCSNDPRVRLPTAITRRGRGARGVVR